MLDGRRHCTDNHTFLGSGISEPVWNAAFEKVGFSRPQHTRFPAYCQLNSSAHHHSTFVARVPIGFNCRAGTDLVMFIKQLQGLSLEIYSHLLEGNSISSHFDKLILTVKWLIQKHLVFGKKLRKSNRKYIENFPEGANRRAGIVAFRLGNGAMCKPGFLGQLTLRIAKEFSQLPYSGSYVKSIYSGLIS